MDRLLRLGAIFLGFVMVADGVALMFTQNGLLPGRSARTVLLFKGVEGIIGYSWAQTLAAAFSLAIGLSFLWFALKWKR
jgi:hypothetical protein